MRRGGWLRLMVRQVDFLGYYKLLFYTNLSIYTSTGLILTIGAKQVG